MERRASAQKQVGTERRKGALSLCTHATAMYGIELEADANISHAAPHGRTRERAVVEWACVALAPPPATALAVLRLLRARAQLAAWQHVRGRERKRRGEGRERTVRWLPPQEAGSGAAMKTVCT